MCCIFQPILDLLWESLRSRWGSGSLEIHWLWKYKYILSKSFSPVLVSRLQTDRSELVNHCGRRAVSKSSETSTAVKRHFWQDDSLDLNFTPSWALAHVPQLIHAWTVQCTPLNVLADHRNRFSLLILIKCEGKTFYATVSKH